MPSLKLYQNGVTSGKTLGKKQMPKSKRGDAKGWTVQVSRRLRKWLYSIPVDSLTGYGLAFTFTVRDCPASAEDWAELRRAFLQTLFDNDCIRAHWLTEWQRRGVPHLHGVAYWPDEETVSEGLGVMYKAWLRLAKKYGAGPQGQEIKLVKDVKGWLEYLSKHAARSVRYYQRSSDNIPEGWKSTGRMWGYRGSWEVREPMKFYIDEPGFFVYRRIAASWWRARQQRLTRAKFYNDIKRHNGSGIARQALRQARIPKPPNKLKCGDPEQSRIMGTSDWIDIETSTKLLVWLGGQGYKVEQR